MAAWVSAGGPRWSPRPLWRQGLTACARGGYTPPHLRLSLISCLAPTRSPPGRHHPRRSRRSPRTRWPPPRADTWHTAPPRPRAIRPTWGRVHPRRPRRLRRSGGRRLCPWPAPAPSRPTGCRLGPWRPPIRRFRVFLPANRGCPAPRLGFHRRRRLISVWPTHCLPRPRPRRRLRSAPPSFPRPPGRRGPPPPLHAPSPASCCRPTAPPVGAPRPFRRRVAVLRSRHHHGGAPPPLFRPFCPPPVPRRGPRRPPRLSTGQRLRGSALRPCPLPLSPPALSPRRLGPRPPMGRVLPFPRRSFRSRGWRLPVLASCMAASPPPFGAAARTR